MKKSTIPSLVYFLPAICYFIELALWLKYGDQPNINALLGALWFVGQLGILVILSTLAQQHVTGNSKTRLIGIYIAGLGAIFYSLNYVLGYWLNFNTRILLPAGALFSGIGMLVVGIQTLRNSAWVGWKKFAPLLVGLHPFLVMLPVLLITGHPSIPAIMLWGVAWLVLAVALSSNPSKAQ